MFPNGCRATHALLVEPQRGFAVLLKGFMQIQGNAPWGTPGGPIGPQDHIRAGQLRAFVLTTR